MGLNFKWLLKSAQRPEGVRCAAVRVTHYVDREDLVKAAAKVIDDIVDEYEPDDAEIDMAERKVSKAKIEQMVTECVNTYGHMWIESGAAAYLNVADYMTEDVVNAAERAVSRLYPELEA